MDFNLADYAMQMPAEDKQALMAQVLRKRQQAEALQQANAQGNRYSNLAAIAQMANNEGAAGAAQAAHRGAQAQYKPVQMGQMGFALPATGEFVESPMYAEEKEAGRSLQKTLGRDRIDAQVAAQRERLDAQAREGEQNRMLRMTLGQMADSRGRDIADLRASLAGAGKEDKAKKGLDSSIQKYTGALEKAGVPEFDQALGVVEQNLNKYPVGKLPAYGRVLSAVPNWALDNEGQGVRADMAQAANILLKSRSGAAVTDSEMRRFLQEVASGGGMAEETLRRGWANVRRSFDAKRTTLAAMLDDAGHQEFTSRGGKDYRQAPKPGDKYLD